MIHFLTSSQKVKDTPSPLMGEGWGEGEYSTISSTYVPLPFVPSRQGRGHPAFYKTANFNYNFFYFLFF